MVRSILISCLSSSARIRCLRAVSDFSSKNDLMMLLIGTPGVSRMLCRMCLSSWSISFIMLIFSYAFPKELTDIGKHHYCLSRWNCQTGQPARKGHILQYEYILLVVAPRSSLFFSVVGIVRFDLSPSFSVAAFSTAAWFMGVSLRT